MINKDNNKYNDDKKEAKSSVYTGDEMKTRTKCLKRANEVTQQGHWIQIGTHNTCYGHLNSDLSLLHTGLRYSIPGNSAAGNSVNVSYDIGRNISLLLLQILHMNFA